MLVDLIKRSDVLIEGFSPGTLERLGLSRGKVSARSIRVDLCTTIWNGVGRNLRSHEKLRSHGAGIRRFERDVGLTGTVSTCGHRIFFSGLVRRLQLDDRGSP